MTAAGSPACKLERHRRSAVESHEEGFGHGDISALEDRDRSPPQLLADARQRVGRRCNSALDGSSRGVSAPAERHVHAHVPCQPLVLTRSQIDEPEGAIAGAYAEKNGVRRVSRARSRDGLGLVRIVVGHGDDPPFTRLCGWLVRGRFRDFARRRNHAGRCVKERGQRKRDRSPHEGRLLAFAAGRALR